MNWLLALLAFAGLMTVLSTVVSIAVETLHKTFSLRRSGLEEMLRAMHDSVLKSIEREDLSRTELIRSEGESKAADEFAKVMTKSPAYGGGGRWWWPAEWKWLNIFQRRFERLTPRQFVEQLSHTEFGQALAQQSRPYVRHVLARASYEFERYGLAQSQFFRQRAKVLSGLAAFLFVCVANLNAIDLYIHLAKDEQALNQTLTALRADDPAYLQGVVAELRAEAADTISPTGDPTQDAAQLQNFVRSGIAEYFSDVDQELQLPIGHEHYPFCTDPARDFAQCGTPAKPISIFGTTIPAPEFVQRLVTQPLDGIVWFMSIVASAGLLALGAPFWFDLFSKTAMLIGSSATKRVVQNEVATTRASSVRKPIRNEDPELEELTDSFFMASGLVRAPISTSLAVGGKLGASSDQVISEGVPFGPFEPEPNPPVDAVIPEHADMQPDADIALTSSEDVSRDVHTGAHPSGSATGRLGKRIRRLHGNWTGE